MFKPADLIPLASVVEEIRILCDARSSGTMFIISELNRMAQVHLSAGQVAAVICRNQRGFAAIQLMLDIHFAHMRFDDSHVVASDGDELLTEVFFGYLGATHQAHAAPAAAPIQGAPLASDVKATFQKGYLGATHHQAHAAPAEAPVRGAPLTSDVKATLQKLLAKSIGPMAEIICLDHFEGATKVLPVIEALANEIPSLEDANKFRSDAARAIDELSGRPKR